MSSRRHRLPIFEIGLALPFLIAPGLRAAVLVYEGFDHDTDTLISDAVSGFGWNGGWYNSATTKGVTGNQGVIASGSLATPAGVIASGSHLERGNLSASGERLLPAEVTNSA